MEGATALVEEMGSLLDQLSFNVESGTGEKNAALIALISSSMGRLRQLIQMHGSPAQKLILKSDSARFDSELALAGQGETEAIDALVATAAKIRSDLRSETDRQSLKPNSRSTGTLRAKAGSFNVNLPRRSWRPATTNSSSPETLSGSPPSSFIVPSIRLPGDGDLSPPICSPRSETATLPPQFRWTIVNELTLPLGWTMTHAANSIMAAFDCLELPEAASTPAGQKMMKMSPRKPSTKRLENAALKFLTELEPLTRSNKWSEIFHARHCIVGTLIKGQTLDRLTQLTMHMITKAESLPNSVLQNAALLQEFLNHWKLDLDSALVGVEPNDVFRSEFCFDTSPVGASLLVEVDESTAAAKDGKKNVLQLTLHDLRQKFVEIADSASAEVALTQVKQLAEVFKLEDLYRMEKGCLCVCQFISGLDGQNHVTFVRVIRFMDQGTLEVHNGRGAVRVRVAQCKRLSQQMVDLIERGQLLQVAVNHEQRLTARMEEATQAMILRELLASMQDDRALVIRTEAFFREDMPVSLFDYVFIQQLDRIVTLFDIVKHATESGFIEELTAIHSDYVAELSLNCFCGKNRTAAINRVLALGKSPETFTGEMFLKLRVRICSAREELDKAFENILSGARKNAMSSAWLTGVRESVNELLTKRGYQADAVPDDYISTAPKDMQAIRSNLEILQNLVTNADKSSALQIITQALRSRAYPVIDSFVDDSIFVIAQCLGCVLSPNRDPVAELETTISSSTPTELFDKRCVGLLADIQYLREMRRLEDNPQESSPHIIPISGLVYSSIIRKEKEILTVIEVWQGKLEV